MNNFVAQIMPVAFNFAPTGFAYCYGQLLPLSQNTALFSLLGTYYGGDGKSNFALPDLQGRTPMGWGQGSALSERFLGESAGESTVTMQANEMPLHNHTFMAYTGTDDANTTSTPGPTVVYGKAPSNGTGPNASASLKLYADPTSLVSLSPIQLGVAGASFPHNNMQPFLAINYVIALQGVFPPRG